ncbi:threonine/serine exporter ThrE family protein [Barnesiella sp. CU968]|jgi:uncharacterized membrane protein YjjP (DUF1212 family)|uniref:threonine/serine ThrE exporter family protein n=1 Tax=Barnesiella sp. CU968 TaxID=2780099 RepID=UPI001957324B|nr:threonine/serine exporter family protein [Barnesiella sp. CU968]MBJ2198749.1 threonine/serine exporter family protein [Muribaculaceae bacterium]MCI9028593.1 threonine/serine exporter family protein [Muribaculaceae bacterium]
MTEIPLKETCEPDVRKVCVFLSDYSAWLLGCGSTCVRLEKNVTRIARAYGKTVDITIMPRHVHISVRDKNGGDFVTSVATIRHTPISFNINTRLSELSWAIAEKRISLREAEERFREIVTNDRQNPWTVLLLVSLANASFCRLFGGDITAMGVVFMATMAGYWLKTQLLSKKVDIRATVAICAFVSAVLGATDSLFALGSTPDIALGTSVLYLVPGIPLLNSFSDMLYRYYICSMSRFFDAVVITGCLSIGLCAAMFMMNAGMF